MESPVTQESNNLDFEELLLISHSLGVDLFKAVISLNLKDKKFPKEFYRNYYNNYYNQKDPQSIRINNLIENGYMFTRSKNYYHVSEKGIEQFKKQYNELVIYKNRTEQDKTYLKHRINFYCSYYNYNFCEDNSSHVINAYINYYLKGFRVSHTTNDVILRFKSELKKFYK